MIALYKGMLEGRGTDEQQRPEKEQQILAYMRELESKLLEEKTAPK